MLRGKKSIKIIALSIFIVIVLVVVNYRPHIIHLNENQSETVYEPELSVLHFPVDLSIQDLQQLANKKLKTVLIDKPQVMKNQKDSLDLSVIRTGDLRFYLKNEKLYAHIPLKVEASIIKKVGKSSLKIFDKKPIIFEIDVYSESSFVLRNDIKIDATTKITDITWKQEPVIKVAGIAVNIRELVDKKLTEKSPEITAIIDEVIKTKINLRKIIGNVWRKLQDSKPVSKKTKDFFIKIHPQHLAVYVDKSRTDSLRLNLVAESKLYLRHSKDTNQIRKVELPKKVTVLNKYNGIQNSRVYLHALLPLNELNTLINEKLTGKEYLVKGLAFKIKSIQLMVGENSLAGIIDVTGSVNGKVKVKGLPVFSSQNGMISIKDKGIESALDEELINVTTDLFIDEILGILNMYSTINSNHFMGQLPELAREQIQKTKIVQKIDFQLYDLSIHSVDLKLAKNNIQLLLAADADFGIAVKKEGLKLKKID